MKVVYNNIIPFPGFAAINLFGVVFARKEYEPLDTYTLNHEAIHTAQQRELLYVGFYLLYFIEWAYRLLFHTESAYRGISFEREAYGHEYNLEYLKSRRRFAQWRRK